MGDRPAEPVGDRPAEPKRVPLYALQYLLWLGGAAGAVGLAVLGRRLLRRWRR